MNSKQPFEFDISVSADKRRRKRNRSGMSGAVETSSRRCEHPNCSKKGMYRAPKSPDHLDEFFWFCREHARMYNLNWDFFKCQPKDEVEKALRSDREKPETELEEEWRAARERRAWSRLGIKDPHEILGDMGTRNRQGGSSSGLRLTPAERRALNILDARENWSRTTIRAQYRTLVKDLHPDMNDGNRADEDRLKEVVWAWDQIKDSRNFRD